MIEVLTYMKCEWLLTAIIFFILLLKLSVHISNTRLMALAQMLLLLNVIIGLFPVGSGSAFGNMFVTTDLIMVEKSILNIGAYLVSLLFANWLRNNDHLHEFIVLMLSAMLGMFFMISSANLLMFYLGLELATIPIAAMVGFDTEKKNASEASMKMILSSAFSSGILLFGISMVYGITGSLDFESITSSFSISPLSILAIVFVFAGFAFKLSVVPFHLWTADVYQGAPASVTAFLSVISKGSIAFALLIALYKVFQPVHQLWYPLVVVLSVLTMIIGNLFALRQHNFKRFIAFSSIAQAGFILVGISSNTTAGTASVVYFILVYLFSNMAALGVADAIHMHAGKERIEDYKGLYQSNPFLSWALALSLFSLAGIPPTAGFFGKLFLLGAGASTGNYVFIAIAGINMIISLYYYLLVVRAVFMEKNPDPIRYIYLDTAARTGLIICMAAILLLGLLSWVYDYIHFLS